MKSTLLNILLLSTGAAAWIVPSSNIDVATTSGIGTDDSDIPPCGVDSPHPCSCPEGTSYLWVQTYFSWGANAWSVRNLTGNFSDLSWVPQKLKKTIGPDNTVGSFRLTSVPLDVGTFDWLEEITEYTTADDGSFTWAFELKNVPIDFQKAPGRFEGEWERFEARANGEHQTDIYWTLYSCHTGGTHSFPVFQMYCHDHVDKTLTEMGVLKGTTTKPYSDIKIGNRQEAMYHEPATSKHSKVVQEEGGDQVLAYGQAYYEEARQFVMRRKGVDMSH